MGFIFRKTLFNGMSSGSNYGTYYSWGTRDARTIYLAQTVVMGIAAALKDMNIGWDLDPSYSSEWIDDPDHPGYIKPSIFYEAPSMNAPDGTGYDEKMPVLFLRNSKSGNKLFISYFCNSARYGIDLPLDQLVSQGNNNNGGPNSDRPSYTGLIMSMIPGDSGQSFGSFEDETFIPSSATRCFGMCEAFGKHTSNIGVSYCKSNKADTTYCWGVFATPYCIAIAASYSPFTTGTISDCRFCFACGRVFGSLAHEESLPNSKYGVIQFTQSVGQANAESGQWKVNNLDFGDANESTIGTVSFRSAYIDIMTSSKVNFNSGSIINVQGNYLGFTSTSNIRVYPDNYLLMSRNVKQDDSNARWVPLVVGVASTNLENDGVIPGDGLKGFLDTDLFRCCRVPANNVLGGGKFYSMDKGLLVGWDPSNDPSL